MTASITGSYKNIPGPFVHGDSIWITKTRKESAIETATVANRKTEKDLNMSNGIRSIKNVAST